MGDVGQGHHASDVTSPALSWGSFIDPHVVWKAERNPDGQVVDFVYLDANPVACDAHRCTREQLVGQRLSAIMPPPLFVGLFDTARHVLEGRQSLARRDFAYAPEPHTNDDALYDVRVVPLDDLVGFTWRIAATRRVDTNVFADSESRYRLLVENATEALAHSRDGLILWVSPGVTAMLGWTPDDWMGKRVEDFVHPNDVHLLNETRSHLTATNLETVRFRMRSRDGRYHWIETHVRPYVDQFGRTDGVAVSFRVVDREVAAERELERRARYDELTGLLNRKEAFDRLNAARDREPVVGHEIAVLFCDIDRLKSINDSFGHAAGDELLRVTADRLRANTRQGDLIARLGGDELLVVLDGVHDLGEAARVAEKLRRRVSDPVPFGEHSIVATLSVGVTLAHPGESEEAVIARADAALYEAKHSGRDQVVSFTARR